MRHGEAEGNRDGRLMGHLDSNLTEAGLSQAKKLGEKLKDIKIDAVYSSDLERAYKTACIICETLETGLKPMRSEKLREIDVGKCSGLEMKMFFKKYPASRNDLEYSFPEGESYKEFYERVIGFVGELERKYSGKTVLVVAHEGVIKAVEYHFGLIDFKKHREVKVPHEYLQMFVIKKGKLGKSIITI